MKEIRLCVFVSGHGFYAVGISPEHAWETAVGCGMKKTYKVGGKLTSSRENAFVVRLPQGATGWEFDGMSVRWEGGVGEHERLEWKVDESEWECDYCGECGHPEYKCPERKGECEECLYSEERSYDLRWGKWVSVKGS